VGARNPRMYTDSYITHRQSSLRVRYHQFNRLSFRKLAKAFDLSNAELTESRFRCKTLSESFKKARPKKRKAVEIGVQDAFVEMVDVRKVKVSMGAIPDTPTPVPVAEEVEDGSDASSIIEKEIVVGELFSDSESGSNYSTEC
jgi:hypothetical protein